VDDCREEKVGAGRRLLEESWQISSPPAASHGETLPVSFQALNTSEKWG